MRRSTWMLLLGGEAAVLLILLLISLRMPELSDSLSRFPFAPAAAGLTALSGLGRIGNGLAYAGWFAVSVLPLLPLAGHCRETGLHREDRVLCLLSLLILVLLYCMMNPGCLRVISPALTEAMLPQAENVLCAAVWSVFVLWLVLRLLRLIDTDDRTLLLSRLRILLYMLCMFFVWQIMIVFGGELLRTAAGTRLRVDIILSVLRFLFSSLPSALDIWITITGLQVLDAFSRETSGDPSVISGKLIRLCRFSLLATAAASALYNFLRIILARWSPVVSAEVKIPVLSFAFTIGVLLILRLAEEKRRLQADNDLII